MSLSERLAEAAAIRSSGRADERSPGRDRATAVAASPVVEAGLPAPCPDCGGRGFLDQIDLGRGVQHEHCRACGATWSRPI